MREFYFKTIRREKGIFYSFFRYLLSFFELIYFLLVKSREILYRAKIVKGKKIPQKVISIGNITTGGTGKTPAVITVAKILKDSGRKVAILSRGYKRQTTGHRSQEAVVSDGKNVLLGPDEAGDEPYLMAKYLKEIPVLVGKDRVKNAIYAAKKFQSTVLILDDGFQYLKLSKDFEIVLIDCLNPFGYDHLLPRGLLRGPLSRLEKADVFILTKTDQASTIDIEEIVKRLKEINSCAPVIKSKHSPENLQRIATGEKENLEFLKDKEISAISGIANPRSFEITLENLGAKITKKFRFPDHYKYKNGDFKEMDGIVVTTEKDSVRMPKNTTFWFLKMNFEITSGLNEFLELLKN